MTQDLSSDQILQKISKQFTGAPSDLAIIEEWIRRTDKEMRRLSLDFNTTFEIARQINSKGLEARRIESYALTTLRGQFGVLKVQLLRQDDLGGNWIGPFDSQVEDRLGFDLDSGLGQALHKYPKPMMISALGDDIRDMPEVQAWRESGFEVMIPLQRTDAELKGVILLGPKFTKTDYTENDLNFLELIASMVAVALHNAQLYMRSILDGLTRVFTRGHFDIQLEQEIDRMKRYAHKGGGRSVSLIMLDVDHFKSINDNYGHQVGDAVLIELAQVLKDNVRSMDVVARYGGEEFILILPETTKDEACILADRLRKRVEANGVQTERFGVLSVTASLGIATFPEDAVSGRELILAADMAMYRAKEGGRNRTGLAPDGRILNMKPAGSE